MIRDKLVPLLKQQYGGASVTFGSPPDPIAIFPAKHPRVGDLSISDDGDEVTIYIGDITHGHFHPYDPSLAQEEIDARVTDEVLEFLADLFADRYLLSKSRQDGSAGFEYWDLDRGSIQREPDTDYFTWSGPIIF
jgi:hypothetical protein